MTGRPYTRADYLALKSAFRRSCEDAGSLIEISHYTRVDPALLSRYGNPERTEFPPVDVMMDVDALSGGDRCLRAWAHLRGYKIEMDEKGVQVEDITRHIGAVGGQSGKLINEMCTAAADGVITPAEAERIEREADDVLDNVRNLQRDCRRIRAAS